MHAKEGQTWAPCQMDIRWIMKHQVCYGGCHAHQSLCGSATGEAPIPCTYPVPHKTLPGAAGNLMTVFSAPDYPQFMHEGIPRYRNKGCVAVLSEPYFCSPEMVKYEAAPRPKVH